MPQSKKKAKLEQQPQPKPKRTQTRAQAQISRRSANEDGNGRVRKATKVIEEWSEEESDEQLDDEKDEEAEDYEAASDEDDSLEEEKDEVHDSDTNEDELSDGSDSDSDSSNNSSSSSATDVTFHALGLAPWQLKVCSSLGLLKPTEIQQLTIPQILAGNNVIGRAKTGSGKTAAFALPILRTLSKDPYGVYALILTPTRELAIQISEQFRVLGASLSLTICVVVGGMEMNSQAIQCSQRPHIMIATPGRLADHIRSGTSIHFSHLKYLVLDECDRLFETCFDDDMQTIYDKLPHPNRRQTLLFSATALTPDTKEITRLQLKSPLFFSTSTDDDAYVKELDQRYLFIPQQLKESYLVHLLQYFLSLSASEIVDTAIDESDKAIDEIETETKVKKLRAKSIRHQNSVLERREKEGELIKPSQQKQIIVFVASCASAAFITTMLSLIPNPIPAAALHSRLSQSQRTASLAMFRNHQRNVLIATDVASRGLDIEHVGVVINYDLPRTQDDYIHRIGRTARAGRGGLALTMVSQYDIAKFQSIESHVGKRIQEFPVSEDSALKLLKPVTVAKHMSLLKMEDWQIAHRKVNRLTKRKKRPEN